MSSIGRTQSQNVAKSYSVICRKRIDSSKLWTTFWRQSVVLYSSAQFRINPKDLYVGTRRNNTTQPDHILTLLSSAKHERNMLSANCLYVKFYIKSISTLLSPLESIVLSGGDTFICLDDMTYAKMYRMVSDVFPGFVRLWWWGIQARKMAFFIVWTKQVIHANLDIWCLCIMLY